MTNERPDHPAIGLGWQCERCDRPYYEHPHLEHERGVMCAVEGISDAYYEECVVFALSAK